MARTHRSSPAARPENPAGNTPGPRVMATLRAEEICRYGDALHDASHPRPPVATPASPEWALERRPDLAWQWKTLPLAEWTPEAVEALARRILALEGGD